MTVLRRVGLLLALSALFGCSGPALPAQSARKVARIVVPARRARAGDCGSHLGRRSEAGRRLLRTPQGVLLLAGVPDDRHVRANIGNLRTQWVGQSMPSPEPAGGRHVDVFYSPHPDDETLSAGVLIAQDIRRGDRVIVVALTDGSETRARLTIGARLERLWISAHGSVAGLKSLTSTALGAARLGEMRRATHQLGVRTEDVYAAHLDAPQSDCGATVSVHEAEQVERAFAQRFPGATHITMSYDAERQQDHLAAGAALRELLRMHVVTDAAWVVSRLWWTLPSPEWHWVTPSDNQMSQAVLRAAAEYERWNPLQHEYAVGLYSVPEQFVAMRRDLRDRVHSGGREVPGVYVRPNA